jgi:hypothetical protein
MMLKLPEMYGKLESGSICFPENRLAQHRVNQADGPLCPVRPRAAVGNDHRNVKYYPATQHNPPAAQGSVFPQGAWRPLRPRAPTRRGCLSLHMQRCNITGGLQSFALVGTASTFPAYFCRTAFVAVVPIAAAPARRGMMAVNPTWRSSSYPAALPKQWELCGQQARHAVICGKSFQHPILWPIMRCAPKCASLRQSHSHGP